MLIRGSTSTHSPGHSASYTHDVFLRASSGAHAHLHEAFVLLVTPFILNSKTNCQGNDRGQVHLGRHWPHPQVLRTYAHADTLPVSTALLSSKLAPVLPPEMSPSPRMDEPVPVDPFRPVSACLDARQIRIHQNQDEHGQFHFIKNHFRQKPLS